MDNWLSVRQSPPGKPPLYSTQEQCPVCGSNRVRITTAKYDRGRDRFVSEDPRPAVAFGVLTWAVATFLLYGMVPYFFGSRSALGETIPGWLPLVLGLVVFMALTVRREWQLTKSVRVDLFTCEHCKHKWIATRR